MDNWEYCSLSYYVEAERFHVVLTSAAGAEEIPLDRNERLINHIVQELQTLRTRGWEIMRNSDLLQAGMLCVLRKPAA